MTSNNPNCGNDDVVAAGADGDQGTPGRRRRRPPSPSPVRFQRWKRLSSWSEIADQAAAEKIWWSARWLGPPRILSSRAAAVCRWETQAGSKMLQVIVKSLRRRELKGEDARSPRPGRALRPGF